MVRLYAHRGAAAELPENTLPSFSRALEVGADALETDVHLTLDGRVVVSHDPSGERMSGIPRAIKDCTLSEIKTWDMGQGFENNAGEHTFAGSTFEVPCLEDILEEFPDVVINVDLKAPSAALVEAALSIIRAQGAEERVQLASFHVSNLARVRMSGYRGLTAMAPSEVALALAGPAFLVRRLPFLGRAAQIPTRSVFLSQPVDALIPGGGERAWRRAPGAELPKRLFPSDRWLFERLRRLGLRVEFWTVNDPDEALALAEMGAHGIMTDDPRRIAEALGKTA